MHNPELTSFKLAMLYRGRPTTKQFEMQGRRVTLRDDACRRQKTNSDKTHLTVHKNIIGLKN